MARPPAGCVARHVLEHHAHAYPWWPHEAIPCGRFNGADYFRRRPHVARVAVQHQAATRAHRQAGHHVGHVVAHKAATRAKAEHTATTHHARATHKLSRDLGEPVPTEPATPEPVGEARGGQPAGDVGEDEDPDVYAAEPGEETAPADAGEGPG